MTIIEKIIANHAGKGRVGPGDIIDFRVDARVARDFGGAGVIQNLHNNNLSVQDPRITYFTFDCNPAGSDQQYASNQQFCRVFARKNNIRVYDINTGIGTHLAIDEGLAFPGSTLVSTDSHANILGAVGALGLGMGDRDIAAAWAHGTVWFRVPESVKIRLTGEKQPLISAKDIILNLMKRFGADGLLGYSVEITGDTAHELSIDERITISSMATELGAVIIFFPPSDSVIEYCQLRSYAAFEPVYANNDADYKERFEIDISTFKPVISLPGQPHNVAFTGDVKGTKIDSVFIGSCTNGRITDMREAAGILAHKKVAPGVVLKIVPSTDEIWNQCLHEGLIDIFKAAGALFGNAGCAGCASGQIGQNGPGEKTISTGNRNFTGKQGKGDVYLSSVSTAAASAVAGYITTVDDIPEHPARFDVKSSTPRETVTVFTEENNRPSVIEGKIWLVLQDNIDTDMIYHNKYLAITDPDEMGKYTFGNLKGWEDYAQRSEPGDIIITGRNFGAGSSRQQAVDCFRALHNQAILAQSFGVIYERNAINAGFPIITYHDLSPLGLQNRDAVVIDLEKGVITNKRNNESAGISRFSDIQMRIYQKGDLLRI